MEPSVIPARLPPGEDEQRCYYYGLISRPRLVARSDTKPWVPLKIEWPRGKRFDPVGEHRIVSLWNDLNNKTLRQEILGVLESAAICWRSIDILRLGHEMYYDSPEEEYHIKLLISVDIGSTTWEQGHAAVMQCHDILQQHDIHDVHCEMKELSIFHPDSRPIAPTTPTTPTTPTAPPNAPKLSTGEIAQPAYTNILFSEYLGHSIAAYNQPSEEGTKCLYLRLRNSEKVLALTCRNVVFGPEALNEDYRHNEAAPESAVTIIQPGKDTFDLQLGIHTRDHHTEEIVALLHIDKIKSEDARKSSIASVRAKRLHSEQAKQMLENHSDPASRIIGHVLFSPKYGNDTPAGSSTQPRLRDWALIELHPGKHTSPLTKLYNQVSATSEGWHRLWHATAIECVPSRVTALPNMDRDTIELQGTLPETEMKAPNGGNPAIIVAKHGKSTGFTIGLANSVMTLRRETIADKQCISEEWCILGQKTESTSRRLDFSDVGDSGACVWDTQARIGGMITGGDGGDITYTTPIEWLLEDIRSYGYDVELCEYE
ncbi:hypothetical protein AK830_g3854 [Neonectria ditissima]|uniref:Uncharacterized protein n=1 Tax=Neonectria ditissima TaxID=78410 RepID=A0A0P7BMV6_9HYPO|nr:hypothetical protein AK830_g3854 [Neonectria ditissima]